MMDNEQIHEMRLAIQAGIYRCGYCGEVIEITATYVDCINRCTSKIIATYEKARR